MITSWSHLEEGMLSIYKGVLHTFQDSGIVHPQGFHLRLGTADIVELAISKITARAIPAHEVPPQPWLLHVNCLLVYAELPLILLNNLPIYSKP